MRFIGNKDFIVKDIIELLESKNILNSNFVFFDAFSGTGAVSDALKSRYNLICNDLMTWSTIFTKGRIYGAECKFDKLKFDPFEYINNNSDIIKGFFYKNYSPGESKRMYFTEENAGRIDYIREKIEDWKNQNLISDAEFYFLIASLIESMSLVANTAGVYGAFLKHWDSRSLKPIKFRKVEFNDSNKHESNFYNKRIEDIIGDIECDILYLDPPYTQNQYGTQYHIFETLVKRDNPPLSPITGSRPTAPMRSDWSKDIKSHILFDKIISSTTAKHIILSYSQDGFMSKAFIEASLKRYGIIETYECINISYSKYTNFKSRSKKHEEYLFYIEKKDNKEVCYESPLNYIGSKAKMAPVLKQMLPENISTFVDAFGGGFNVGINIDMNEVIYNDINPFVCSLVSSFKLNDTYQYILYIRRIIKKFNLEPNNSEAYLNARNYYNSLPSEKKDPKLLYSIILYGFNQQIRFNNNHQFNNPVGVRWFNDKILEKVISFSRVIKEKNIKFYSGCYSKLFNNVSSNYCFYFDPPYMFTTGSYNDGKRGFKGWNIDLESEFLSSLSLLNDQGIRFMFSYIIEHKGEINDIILKWINKNKLHINYIDPKLGNNRKEVVITNYKFRINGSFIYNKE